MELIHKDLSFKVNGVLFDVFNTLGYGYKEVYYQRAIAEGLRQTGLRFEEQMSCPLSFKGMRIGVHRFDFFIEDKLILEIKQGDHFSKTHIVQLHGYLKSKNLSLGILAYYSSRGLKFKRIVNLRS